MKIGDSQNETLVCVPAFNAGRALRGTLMSILDQSYRNFDILVLDNCSTDGTYELAGETKREFDKEDKIYLLKNQKNVGRIGNWNQCLKMFQGTSHTYLKFVFTGDTLEKSCLQRMVDVMERHPRLGFVASGYFVHASDNEIRKKVSFEQPLYASSFDALRLFLQKGNWVGAPVSCMFSREAVLAQRFSEKLGWTADWKFCVDVASVHDSFYIPELLSRFYASQRKYYSRHRADFFANIQDFLVYGAVLRLIAYIKLRSILHFLKIARSSFLKWLVLPANQRYAYMQKLFYNDLAEASSYSAKAIKDLVVGSYKEHDAWKDYDEYLMKYIDGSYTHKLALDFGCGPGRHIVKYAHRFERLDGVDISEKNIRNAKENLVQHGIKNSKLYVNNGIDLGHIPSSAYDFVMSTICLQHICVYSIRYNLLKEFFRVLVPGGRISMQMGYGKNAPDSVPYETDNAYALTTNRGCDTRVENPEQIKTDLEAVGFRDFEYWIRPTGPGDTHPHWIFCTAKKQ